MNHTRRRIAIGLAIAALAPGVAQASIPHEPGADPTAAGSVLLQSRPIVIEGQTGFDWTDAGVGFASAAGLALLGAGSILTIRWHQTGRPPLFSDERTASPEGGRE
jgi:hypothetical protein